MAARIFPTDAKTIKVVVLCLVAATTFKFFLALNKDDYTTTISYPIQFQFDQNSYIATEELPNEVQINVSGGGWNILRLGYLDGADPINYRVENPDRSNRIAGNSLFGPISEVLSDLELNYVLQDTLYLNIEKKVSKKINVQVDSAGVDLARDHYIVSQVRCNLDSVEITGPESIIQNYPDTAWIQVTDRRVDSNFDRDVPIAIFNDLITVTPETARVTFDVERFVEVNRNLTLTKWNFPQDSSIVLADSIINVSFEIRESRSSQVENDEFMIVVDYNRMVTYDSTIQCLIMKYPLDIRSLEMERSRAKVIKVEE